MGMKQHKQIKTKHLTNKKGMTLIEILISLAIFGILMVLFSTLMGIAIQMRKNVFEQNTSSMTLMKDLATDGADEKAGQIVLHFTGGNLTEGKTLTIPGTLKSKEGEDVSYYVFIPGE